MIDPSDENIYSPYLRVVDFAIDRLEDRTDQVVLLDAGCGHSTLLKKQYDRCSQVIGVDLDRKGLNRNKMLDKKIFADLTDIPLPDQSVDIITSAWVLEHIEKPGEFISEVNRLLRPGGYFSFIAPNKDSWYAILSGVLPQSIHKKAAEGFYGRGVGDTFDTFYRMNSEEDIDKLLQIPTKYKKIEFIYNDDPKYLGVKAVTRPFAKAWHKVVMTKPMRMDRVHIIGLYKRLKENKQG